LKKLEILKLLLEQLMLLVVNSLEIHEFHFINDENDFVFIILQVGPLTISFQNQIILVHGMLE
jgi:hypothetical protein